MEHKDYFYLGYLSKAVGNKGEISAVFETDQPENYAHLSMVFVDLKGSLIPYQIQNINFKGNKTHIKFEDIDNTEKADFLGGYSLYLPLSMLPKLKGNNFYYHEIIGFEVEDKTQGPIGTIQNVIDQSAQAIFQIDKDGTEILIPIADDIITKVDRKKKKIHIVAPEGLIDLYLGDETMKQ